jgi:hypothetical protein
VNPNRLYFVTTDAITAPSRLWALDFTDAKNPAAGGTIKMLLDGSEGQVMMDNMTVGADGHVYIQEDPGNNARMAKVWDYNPLTDTLTQVAEHDNARFNGVNTAFNQDEESSGIIDVTTMFNYTNKWVYLLDTQAHFTSGLPAEVVEKGQLQLMVVDRTTNGTAGNDTFAGTAESESYNAGAGNDTVTGGGGNDWLNGGAGDDTAVFNFKLTDAKVEWTNAGIVLTGPDGRDILVNFEHYQFTDGTVNANDGNGMVDDLYYYITNPDVWAAKVDAEAHFAAFGWKEGRNPDAYFDVKGYLAANPDVKNANVNPLLHFNAFGWKEGRDPSANFDGDKYLAAYQDVKNANINPLEHYLVFGHNSAEGRFAFGDGLFN